MFDSEQAKAQILQTCLDAVQSGRDTLESILARYPELEDELRPILENAAWLASHRALVEPDREFVARSRARLMSRLAAEQPRRAAPPARASNFFTNLISLLRMPPVIVRAAITMVLVLTLLMGADSVVETTEGAIPGDPGYSVKRTMENLTLAVSNDPGQQIVLYLEYSQRRLSEASALVETARFSEATTSLTEFQNQVREAVTSLDDVRDEDTVHKELLAMTIQEKLSDHARQLTTLLPKVPESAKPAVTRALVTSNEGAVVAQTTMQRLMTMKTPAPGLLDLTTTPEPGAGAPALDLTPTAGSYFPVVITPTEEYRQIISSTSAPEDGTTGPGTGPAAPTAIVMPTAEPKATATPNYPTPVPTDEELIPSPTPDPFQIQPTSTPQAPTYAPTVGAGANSTSTPAPAAATAAPAPASSATPETE